MEQDTRCVNCERLQAKLIKVVEYSKAISDINYELSNINDEVEGETV